MCITITTPRFLTQGRFDNLGSAPLLFAPILSVLELIEIIESSSIPSNLLSIVK